MSNLKNTFPVKDDSFWFAKNKRVADYVMHSKKNLILKDYVPLT